MIGLIQSNIKFQQKKRPNENYLTIYGFSTFKSDTTMEMLEESDNKVVLLMVTSYRKLKNPNY